MRIEFDHQALEATLEVYELQIALLSVTMMELMYAIEESCESLQNFSMSVNDE